MDFGINVCSLEMLSPTVISSTLFELSVCLISFEDCLPLLDGRFNQLRLFDAKIESISYNE